VALILPPVRRAWTNVRLRLALLLVCAVFPFPATARQQHGPSPISRTIEGTVLDPAGHPVPGAVVLLEELKSLQVRSYIVQGDGKFHFRGLSSDANYELRARFHGVASKPKTVTVFESHPAVVVNLMLPLKQKRPTPPPHPTGNPS